MIKILKKYYILLVLLGMLISFISINIIFSFCGENSIADLTQDKHYSLSAYSIQQTKELSQPLYITVYYSSEIATENPIYNKYAEFVLSFLQQYQRQNPDKISIAIKNPKPYSEGETEALQAGITAFATSGGESNLYFGAVFRDGDDKSEVIPYFSTERDFWLEKDITSVLAKFNEQKRTIVGLISPVYPFIKKGYGKDAENSLFIQELMKRYNILELPANETEIPPEIDVLLVAVPRKMTTSLTYALDQFVLRGGKLILLLDMLIEEPFYKPLEETMDNLNNLLKNWGIHASTEILGSRLYGKKIFLENNTEGVRQVPYPVWIDLPQSSINQETLITKGLKSIKLRTPIEVSEIEHNEDITVTPLLQVEESYLYPRDIILSGKEAVVSHYKADNQKRTLAVLSEGKYPSIFEHAPEFVENTKYSYMYYSYKPTQILVIGDSDFIRDNIWYENDELSDNGQMLLKAIEIFNEKEAASHLYKSQSKLNQESLGKYLYDQASKKYLDDISLLQNEYENLRQEYEYIQNAIQNHRQNIDAYTASRLSDMRDKEKELRTRLQYYEYDIKRLFNSKTQKVIFMNIAVIPIIIVLIWIIGYNRYMRRYRQKIKEKFNGHK